MPASDVIEMSEPRFLSTRHRTFYGDSGYSNFGYWTDGTATGREACDQLLDRLLGMLPAPPAAVVNISPGQRLLADTGFNAVVIEEAIAKTFLPCSRRFLRHAWLEYLQPGRWPAVLREAPPVALWWTTSRRHLEEYLLVRAVRPQEQRP